MLVGCDAFADVPAGCDVFIDVSIICSVWIHMFNFWYEIQTGFVMLMIRLGIKSIPKMLIFQHFVLDN